MATSATSAPCLRAARTCVHRRLEYRECVCAACSDIACEATGGEVVTIAQALYTTARWRCADELIA